MGSSDAHDGSACSANTAGWFDGLNAGELHLNVCWWPPPNLEQS